jgi:cytoskeletal protein CcmA (bactofilin family)
LHDLEVEMNRRTRILSLLTLLVLALFVLVPAASAFDGRSGDRVVIGKDEVINDDLFVGGTTVVVDGTVNGDLIAGGETVTINGKVTGNVFAAGSSLTVNGSVGHDLVAAGAAVTIGPNARIGHNVYAFGASVESQPGSQVGGSLVFGAGQGLVSGQTTNDLLAGASRVRLEGTVGRNAKITVGSSDSTYSPSYYYGSRTPAMPSVQAGLTFGPEAHVVGALEYVSPETVAVPPSVAAQVTHTLPPQDQQLSRELAQRQSTSSYVFDAVRRLVGLLLVGLLIALVAPRWITGPADKLLSKPLSSLGVGLVGLVAAPLSWLVALGVVVTVAAIFGLLSLGGLTALILLAGLPALGIALVALLFIASYLCQAIIAYLGGRLILRRIRPEWNSRIYRPLLIGLLILGLLIALPVAGGWLQFLVILAGLGAIALVLLQGRPAPQTPAEVPTTG